MGQDSLTIPGGEIVWRGGDVGGQGGHGDGLQTISHWTSDISVPTLGLMLGQDSQQFLHGTASVLVGAGVGQEVNQSVGHVRHALVGHTDAHVGPTRGTRGGTCDAHVADQVTITTTLDWSCPDCLQTHRTLQR